MSPRLSAIALVMVGLFGLGGFSSMFADAGTSPPRCHGQEATVVGTPGRDSYSDARDDDPMNGNVFVLLGGDDQLKLTETRGVIVCAGGGDDKVELYRSAGAELLDGGQGADKLGDFDDPDFAVLAKLRILGGPGDDIAIGGGAKDLIKAGPGDDGAFGFGSDDEIFGGSGDDLMKGYQNNDTLHGGSGDDRIFGDGYKYYDPAPNDRAIGGPGADRCEAERKRSCER